MAIDFKKEIKEAWDDNKDKIIFCAKGLVIGLVIGYFKGLGMRDKLILNLISKLPDAPNDDDDMILDASTVDDPDLIDFAKESGYTIINEEKE